MEKSTKNWWVAFLLNWFVWWCGAHNWYLGNYKRAVIEWLTAWCLVGGILSIIDLVKLLQQKYTDSEGKVVMR